MKSILFCVWFTCGLGVANATVITDSVIVDGHYRVFHFNQQRGSTKYFDLVFVLHGSGGNGLQMMEPAASLEKIAGKEKMLLVYPDGYKKYWNECRKNAISDANAEDINEQAFFTAMASYFKKKYGTHARGFFIIGLSGGGHMAYKLAMTMTAKCIAISAVVANLPDTMNLDCEESKQPVAVLIANGTNDKVNPYNGGEMIMGNGSWGNVRSTQRSFQYWAGLAGYTGEPAVTQIPDTDIKNQQTITRYTFRQTNQPEVTLLAVTGGEHTFPKDLDIFIESMYFFKRELQRRAAMKR